MAIKHAGYWKPKVFPVNGDVTPAEIDRLQEFRGAPTLPVDQLYEIGRYAKMCSQKRPPEVAVSQRQYEYGNLEYYLKLANLSSGDKVELKDFDDAFVHFVGYEGLDENIFTSSILIPRGRLNGMTLSLAGPEDIIERTFDFTADTKIIWQNNNKYFIYKRFIVESGNLGSGNISTFTVDDPSPVKDDDKNNYLWEVYRVRDGETVELVPITDFSFDNVTGILTVQQSEVGDVIKVYYTSSVYISGQQYHTLNDSDSYALRTYNASIYLIDGVVSNYIYRLSALSIDTGFDRQDVKELGNIETVETGSRTRTVRVSANGFTKDYALEEILRGVYGQNYGKIDIEKFKDTIALVVKIYETSDKLTFKIGYQVENLPVASLDKGVPVNDFLTKAVTLESDNLLITTNESNLLI